MISSRVQSKKIIAGIVFTALLIIVKTVFAAEFVAYVISVADGDTITVADSRSQHLRIRLAGIDAPERGQPFGKQSADNLSRLVRRQEVRVEWHKKDQYGRLIGVVFRNGKDINLEQVRAGYAWWYREYADEQTPSDRISYDHAEHYAKENRLGLWSTQNQIPPWEWRRIRFAN